MPVGLKYYDLRLPEDNQRLREDFNAFKSIGTGSGYKCVLAGVTPVGHFTEITHLA